MGEHGGGDRIKGKCKWFNATKGYGFIESESGEDGYRTLTEGEEVEFKVETDSNGRRKAANVTGPENAPIKGAPPGTGDRHDGGYGGGNYRGGGYPAHGGASNGTYY